MNITFSKTPLPKQIFIGLAFGVVNYFFYLFCSQLLHIPLFMDNVFIFGAAFFGFPSGMISAFTFHLIDFLVKLAGDTQSGLQVFYSICSFTAVFLTWALVTRHRNFSWILMALLVFVVTIVVSIEGAAIYSFIISQNSFSNENRAVYSLYYILTFQNFGIFWSATLARIPINLCDKATAVFGGFSVWICVNSLMKKFTRN